MNGIEGKVAWVTGGARGLGRAHALRLASDGADIVVSDLVRQIPSVPYPMSTENDLAETVAAVRALGRRCIGIQADVRSQADMERVVADGVAEYGKIDILVANAGVTIPSSWDATEEQFDDVVDTSLKGSFLASRAVVGGMIERGTGGSIVMTASVAGMTAYYGVMPYVAAKHGVIGLMRSLAAELAPHRIRVNVVSPGLTETPIVFNDAIMNEMSGKEGGGTRDDVAFAGRSISLLPESWMQPEDIANAVAWLCSDQARYITGVALPVDLGSVNQPPGTPPMQGWNAAPV